MATTASTVFSGTDAHQCTAGAADRSVQRTRESDYGISEYCSLKES